MATVLYILGAIASIVGAIIAIFAAIRSKKSAKLAEDIRDEMISHRKMVEVSQVYARTTSILNIVSKVGPSCNIKLLRGVNCADIAKYVEEYTRFIMEQSAHFNELFGNKAKELCDDIKTDIENLAEANSFEEKKKYGKRIYYKIENFMPEVKNLSDDKKESTVYNK